MATPGSTVFPLLQTVMVSDSKANGSDTATMSAGASLILGPTASQATFNVANSAVQVSNADLIKQPQTVFYETAGSTVIRLQLQAMTWTSFGMWSAAPGGAPTTHYANFVTGFQTPASAVPTTGTATYSGTTLGLVFGAGGGGPSDALQGEVSLVANFANHTVDGTLFNMVAGDPWWLGAYEWNSVSLSASFAAGQSGFAGTTAATSAPGKVYSLQAGATGTVVGSFFGPQANEIGAVWTLSDGINSATGSIGATRAP